VSRHLRIPLAEYDARIRTFVPFYEEMLTELAGLVDGVAGSEPSILDLGIGTGSLAGACRFVRPRARLFGIDADPQILEMARARLEPEGQVDLRAGSFLDLSFPRVDLIVASLSLHHVANPGDKQRLYARCRRALGDRGSLILADCLPPSREDLLRRGMEGWKRHLEQSYAPDEAEAYLKAWAEEDRYFPLVEEMRWLRGAGFRPEVIWRRCLFAVLLCS
jgi:SAM-dependent methyltransferase